MPTSEKIKMTVEEVFLNSIYNKIKLMYIGVDINLYSNSVFIKIGETVYIINYTTSPVLWIFKDISPPTYKKISSIDEAISLIV